MYIAVYNIHSTYFYRIQAILLNEQCSYPYISFLSQGSTNISYTVWFSSHWTEQNSANLLKIKIVANAVLCHTYAWFRVLLNFPPHTHCVTHSLQCRLYVYKSASSFSIVNFVGRITYRFIAPRASTSVASVWFDDRKRNPLAMALQEPLEPSIAFELK